MRVDDAGSDEVAVVARAFNVAAGRIEHLLTAQKALLANASHELRSPLARLRMAIELWLAEAKPRPRRRDHAAISPRASSWSTRSCSRAASTTTRAPRPGDDRVDLLGLAAEEAARLEPGVASVSKGAASRSRSKATRRCSAA